MKSARRQATRQSSESRRIPAAVVRTLLWVVVMAPLLAGSVYAARWLLDPATFPVRAIKVKGEFRYLARENLQKAVESHIGQGLLRVNVEMVRGAVEQLPWVRSVEVRRIWPEGLEVSVLEQQPLARWGASGLVNGQGERFAAAAGTGPDGLPTLMCPAGTSSLVTARYREFSTRLSQSGEVLTHLELDQRNAWRLQLASGLIVDLGREDVSRRLERFARLYQRIVAKDSRCPKRVDLRYANGFAVEFAEVETPPKEQGSQRQGVLRKGELAHAKKA